VPIEEEARSQNGKEINGKEEVDDDAVDDVEEDENDAVDDAVDDDDARASCAAESSIDRKREGLHQEECAPRAPVCNACNSRSTATAPAYLDVRHEHAPMQQYM
jgi:hypothetical protein